jgi:FtsP/CotA-like multicopper oxidase with cupredoxin domain
MSGDDHKERPVMWAIAHRKRKAVIALVAATTIAATAAASAVAQLDSPGVSTPTTTIELCAKAGTLSLPGGVTVPVWGFAQLTGAQTCADVSAQVPGPVLDVAQGAIVRIVVHNGLSQPVGLQIPGEAIEEGPVEAPAGGTANYTFTASAPGTRLYESPANGGRQLAMGLYGALIVRSETAGQAYGTPASAYDVEATLVLSAIDPAFNAAPDTYNMLYWAPTYWLINGKAYPQTDPISAPGGSKILLRYLNAGFDNTSMALLGAHERVIARDAYPVNPFDAVSETIAAGQTTDAILTAPASGASFPLSNRQLHLTNGTAGTPAYSFPGGMMTFIQGS